jgi:hypothetical protein
MLEAGRWKDLWDLMVYPWFVPIFRKAVRNKVIRTVCFCYAVDEKVREKIQIFGPAERRNIKLMFDSFILWEKEKTEGRKKKWGRKKR